MVEGEDVGGGSLRVKEDGRERWEKRLEGGSEGEQRGSSRTSSSRGGGGGEVKRNEQVVCVRVRER